MSKFMLEAEPISQLEALEKEEDARERAGLYYSDESEEIKEMAVNIRHNADQYIDQTRKHTTGRKIVVSKAKERVRGACCFKSPGGESRNYFNRAKIAEKQNM